jgi:nitronate monooxygenase
VFKTRITRLLGIEYPIIQGALLWLSTTGLVSAVSNAGGLGIIAALTFPTAKELREEIRKTKSMTDKPFAVNITLLPTIRPVNYEEYITTALDEGVNIIETAGQSPEPFMKLIKQANARIMHKVARLRDAKSVERMGVDAVTIVGFEAAGHPGMDDVSSSILIPMCADSLKVPVIAAGGISDGRGLAAALALGAEGVLMGTRFMASKECPMHPKIKQWLLDAHELMPLISGDRSKGSYISGDINDATIACGQAVGLIHNIPSVKEIIDGIINEARLIGQRLYALETPE